MNFWQFVAAMFNGNETARSMRYSSFVIIVAAILAYYHVFSSEVTASIITASMGYIFGKGRNDTHYVPGINLGRRRADIVSKEQHDTGGVS